MIGGALAAISSQWRASRTCSDSSSSGPGTSGIIADWCSSPSSRLWNETEHARIGLPCCEAVRRRLEKLPPSNTRVDRDIRSGSPRSRRAGNRRAANAPDDLPSTVACAAISACAMTCPPNTLPIPSGLRGPSNRSPPSGVSVSRSSRSATSSSGVGSAMPPDSRRRARSAGQLVLRAQPPQRAPGIGLGAVLLRPAPGAARVEAAARAATCSSPRRRPRQSSRSNAR